MNGTMSLKNDICDIIVHTLTLRYYFSVCCLFVMCVIDINTVQWSRLSVAAATVLFSVI